LPPGRESGVLPGPVEPVQEQDDGGQQYQARQQRGDAPAVQAEPAGRIRRGSGRADNPDQQEHCVDRKQNGQCVGQPAQAVDLWRRGAGRRGRQAAGSGRGVAAAPQASFGANRVVVPADAADH